MSACFVLGPSDAVDLAVVEPLALELGLRLLDALLMRRPLLVERVLGNGVGAFRQRRAAAGADDAADHRADRPANRRADADAGQAAGGGALRFIAAARGGEETQSYDAEDRNTHVIARWLVITMQSQQPFLQGGSAAAALDRRAARAIVRPRLRGYRPWPSPIPS